MSRPAMALILALISAAVLIAVFGIQYFGGAAPCQMCIWQRWPYAALIAIGVIGWFWRPSLMLTLALPVLALSAGLGAYHVGVEQGWIALPEGCAAGGDARTIEELRAMLSQAAPTCDQVGFTLLGLSLAVWNVIGSLALLVLVAGGALVDRAGRHAGGQPSERTPARS